MGISVKIGNVVAIDWYDHFEGESEQAWQDVSAVDATPLLFRSVGVVVKTTRDAIALSSTYDASQGKCSATSVVLKSAIVAIHPIKLPPKRRTRKGSPNA